jgi:hypothetical protein
MVVTIAWGQQPLTLSPGFQASQLGTFQVGSPGVGYVLPQSDGKIIISGFFNLTGLPAQTHTFTRLLSNGLRDFSFIGAGEPGGAQEGAALYMLGKTKSMSAVAVGWFVALRKPMGYWTPLSRWGMISPFGNRSKKVTITFILTEHL